MEELSINQDHFINKTLALAGITQAVSLVYELATHGNYDKEAFSSSINSIYKINSHSIEEVYQGIKVLQFGLTKLISLLTYQHRHINKDIMRYFTGILTLERKLMKDQQRLTLLQQRLQTILKQVEYFSPLNETVLENLGSLYSDTIGQFKMRIIVVGKNEYLKTNDIVYKIRALLLAGIRSAVLWRQLGGNRWQLIFYRNQLIKTCKFLLHKFNAFTDS